MNARIQRVRNGLASDGLTSLIVTSLSNIFYLTGFRGSDGALLLTQERAVLLVDGRYGTQARSQAPDVEIVVYPEKISGITNAIAQARITKLGFEPRAISHEFFTLLSGKLKEIQLQGVGEWFHSLRAVKEPQEIEILKKANRISDEAARETLKLVKPGIEEKEISAELEYRMRKGGAERAAFIIVAGGERAALPHAMPTSRKLKSGEMFVLDFGVTFEGYQTDQTLTIAVGEPPSKLKEIYSIVKEAHDRAMAAVKPGAQTKDIDHIARSFITDKGYGQAFGHGLGHGVGIEVHEFPNLSWRTDSKLEQGMVITIEPGIYLPDVGGVRIEDTLLVTGTGFEVLTSVDKAFLSL